MRRKTFVFLSVEKPTYIPIYIHLSIYTPIYLYLSVYRINLNTCCLGVKIKIRKRNKEEMYDAYFIQLYKSKIINGFERVKKKKQGEI